MYFFVAQPIKKAAQRQDVDARRMLPGTIYKYKYVCTHYTYTHTFLIAYQIFDCV